MPLNAADKKFLKEMVAHHKVAVKMEGWLKEVGEKPYGSMGGM